ncbi:MAG: amino acid ABC transporter permease [Bacilli bacterium]|jgi:polar amino acid transport system permease protein
MMEYLGNILPYLWEGLKISLGVFSITLVVSLPLGLLGALLKRKRIPVIASLLDGYTWVIRGTPLLLQLFFVVYGLPILLGDFFLMDERVGAILTFIINYTAYFIEIFRGGMNAIPPSQYEASTMLSLRPLQTYLYVIFPQTLKKTLPSLTNETITLIKDTALVSAVAIGDLLRNTKETVLRDFRVDAYLVAGAMYLLLTLIVVQCFRYLEKRNSHYA